MEASQPFQHRWRSWSKQMAVGLVALTFICGPARGLAANRLEFTSSPSSYIGSGESVSAGPETGFSIYATTYAISSLPWHYSYPYGGLSPIWFSINNHSTNPDPLSARSWELRLEAPWLQRLQIGTYSGATRFSDVDIPGLELSGNGRGVSNLRGSFEVLDASYNEDDGTLLKFAADFLQHDGINLNGWVKGAIRYNSDIPISLAPEPYTPPSDLPLDPADESIGTGSVVTDPLVEGGGDDHGDGLEPSTSGVEPSIGWFSNGSSSSSFTLPTMLNVVVLPMSGTPAPGPLPAAAALVGWRWSRRLRRRCQQQRSCSSHAGRHA